MILRFRSNYMKLKTWDQTVVLVLVPLHYFDDTGRELEFS